MPDLKNKLEVFKETVLGDSSEEVGRITDELKASTEKTLKQYKEQAKAEVERYKVSRLAAIDAREHKRVSTHHAKCRQKQLISREKSSEEIQQILSERISKFTQSSEYTENLKMLLKKALDCLNTNSPCDVHLRAEDMYLADYLRESANRNDLTFVEANFFMGGLSVICPAKKQRIDLSYDSTVHDMKKSLYVLSDIQEVR